MVTGTEPSRPLKNAHKGTNLPQMSRRAFAEAKHHLQASPEPRKTQLLVAPAGLENTDSELLRVDLGLPPRILGPLPDPPPFPGNCGSRCP